MPIFRTNDRHSRPASSLFSTAVAMAYVAVGMGGSPASAQAEITAAAAATANCHVFTWKSNSEGQRQLLADCGGQGLMLGPVSDFTVIANESLGATLIDARFATERRVLLLSMQADGQPLLENLNGEIGRAAGRGPMSNLTGVTIDFEQFARTGTLGVRGLAADTGPEKTDQIDLGRQIADERARMPGVLTKQ